MSPVWALIPFRDRMALGPLNLTYLPRAVSECHPAGVGASHGIWRDHAAHSRFSTWALRMSAHPAAQN